MDIELLIPWIFEYLNLDLLEDTDIRYFIFNILFTKIMGGSVSVLVYLPSGY